MKMAMINKSAQSKKVMRLGIAALLPLCCLPNYVTCALSPALLLVLPSYILYSTLLFVCHVASPVDFPIARVLLPTLSCCWDGGDIGSVLDTLGALFMPHLRDRVCSRDATLTPKAANSLA